MYSDHTLRNTQTIAVVRRHTLLLLTVLMLGGGLVIAQPDGTFQLHFMDVDQGDGALLITPEGKTILFDDGDRMHCSQVLDYLQRMNIQKIDYHITSHYHSDHIGCADQVLTAFPLTTAAYDRGGTYGDTTTNTIFMRYKRKVGNKRKTVVPGRKDTIGSVVISFVASNARTQDGLVIDTDNENDLSVVCVIHYGQLDIVMGGDLSGYDEGDYEDIESDVAPFIGQVEVYKVNHHCSRYSTNDTWLGTLRPQIGIISVGDDNRYGHPAFECLDRLHREGVKTYWTSDGEGAPAQDEIDVVANGAIVLRAPAGGSSYTISYAGDINGSGNGSTTDRFTTWESSVAGGGSTPALKYAWSKKSQVYHFIDCADAKRISPDNYQAGTEPPEGKRLHTGCPR